MLCVERMGGVYQGLGGSKPHDDFIMGLVGATLPPPMHGNVSIFE